MIADNQAATTVFGRGDSHLQQIEKAWSVKLTARGNTIAISGTEEAQSKTRAVLDLLAQWAGRGESVRAQTVEMAIAAVRDGLENQFLHLLEENLYTTTQGRVVRPKTLGQQVYVEAIRRNTLVFGMGPAGTGKTFLAMVMAVSALKSHSVERIVLTRPAVEAGEKLGFLPGDLEDKVDPYLRPLYDALFELLGTEAVDKYRERGHIEIAPLAYMRGRTLNQSFVILDEAQNTTSEQMKMFLTRLGAGSRMVVNGDQTQVDLPRGHACGLTEAVRILETVEDIGVVRLSERDVIRHPLVAKIVEQYRRFEETGGS